MICDGIFIVVMCDSMRDNNYIESNNIFSINNKGVSGSAGIIEKLKFNSINSK